MCLPALGAAQTCGAGATPVFTCNFPSGRVVEICHDGSAATYAFGRVGALPDLTLSAPLDRLDYQPWNGIGRVYIEAIRFRNAGFEYETFVMFDRLSDAGDAALEGGIEIRRGETYLDTFLCQPESLGSNLSALWDIKVGLGQCWDYGENVWVPKATLCGGDDAVSCDCP